MRSTGRSARSRTRWPPGRRPRRRCPRRSYGLPHPQVRGLCRPEVAVRAPRHLVQLGDGGMDLPRLPSPVRVGGLVGIAGLTRPLGQRSTQLTVEIVKDLLELTHGLLETDLGLVERLELRPDPTHESTSVSRRPWIVSGDFWACSWFCDLAEDRSGDGSEGRWVGHRNGKADLSVQTGGTTTKGAPR